MFLEMSRARLICSDILSRMSSSNQLEDKDDLSDQTSSASSAPKDNLPEIKREDIFETSSEMNINCLDSVESDQMSVDDWIRHSNIVMECVDSGSFNVDNNTEVDTSNFFVAATKENLMDDPLLNMRVKNMKRDLETVSDCDIIYKGRWDTLSIASRKSDCDNETDTDFTDFNLSYSFDHSDIGTFEPILSRNMESFVGNITNDYESEQDKLEVNIPVSTDNVVETKTIDKYVLNHNVDSKKIDKNMNVGDKYKKILDSDMIMLDLHNTILLRNDENNIYASENLKHKSATIEQKLKPKISDIENMEGSIAIVSNAMNSARPRTKMIIKTNKGDERYEGNTSELMQSPCRQKKDRQPVVPTPGKHIITSVKTAANITKEVTLPITRETRNITSKNEPDDQLIKEMLSVLGITDDMLYTVLTNLGLRVWVCPEHDCRRIFNRLHTLKTHILSHYGLKPFKCDYPNCQWSFYTSFKLKRHKETHLKKKNFTCTVSGCNRSFTTVYNLNTHLKLHDRPAILKCLVENCNHRFQTIREREKHLKTHEDSLAPYRCKQPGCNKFYFSFSSLNAHSRCHQHKREELTCQWQGCGRVFDKPCRLKAHVRQHTGDKPYVCNYKDCKWAFFSSSKLKRHQHKHIGERRFRCTIGNCTKAFMRSEHLKDHTLTHIGSRSFQCPYCEENFAAKATLYVHKKKNHSAEMIKEKNASNSKNSVYHQNKLNNNKEMSNSTITSDSAAVKSLGDFEFSLCQDLSLDNVLLLDKQKEMQIDNKINTNSKTKLTKKSGKKVKKKNDIMTTSESCARTYLAYQSINDGNSTETSHVQLAAPLSPSLITDVQTDVGLSDIDSTIISYTNENGLSDSLTLSDASNEMLINTDLLSTDSQQPIFLSNLVLQDDTGSNLFGSESSNEYILLLDPSLNPGFSESTINLKDLN